MTRQCTACGRPTDLFGCRQCADRLSELLADVPALVVDLEVTRTRLDRMGTGGRSSERPLMIRPWTTEVIWALGNTLGTWASLVAEDRGLVLDLKGQRAVPPTQWSGRAIIPALPANDVASLAARWLLRYMKSVQMTESFAELADEVRDAVWAARRAVDRPADRAYVGVCDGTGSVNVQPEVEPCGYVLYADPDWATITCRTCGYEYDVQLRREWMLEDLRWSMFTAAHMPRALGACGVTVAASTVRVWAHRGKLRAREWTDGISGQRHPLYLVDDVITVAAGGTVDDEEAS